MFSLELHKVKHLPPPNPLAYFHINLTQMWHHGECGGSSFSRLPVTNNKLYTTDKADGYTPDIFYSDDGKPWYVLRCRIFAFETLLGLCNIIQPTTKVNTNSSNRFIKPLQWWSPFNAESIQA